MISATPAAATSRLPLRAHEPQDPVLRAGLAAVRWKRGNPYCDRATLRVAQRFAFGLDKPAVARAEGTDEAAIDALLAQDGFAEVIASWRDILDESSPAFMARLEKLCRIALTNALAEWDVGRHRIAVDVLVDRCLQATVPALAAVGEVGDAPRDRGAVRGLDRSEEGIGDVRCGLAAALDSQEKMPAVLVNPALFASCWQSTSAGRLPAQR